VTRYVLRRLAILPAALLLVNFLGFAYAHLVWPVQSAANPLMAATAEAAPLLPSYLAYVAGWLRLDFGSMPPAASPVLPAVAAASLASLGLITLALLVSLVAGVGLGIAAVQRQSGVAGWLTLLTTAGLAMPGFYIGSLLIMAALAYLMSGRLAGRHMPLPVQGFGWNLHLVLPVLVLAARPTAQIAQVTASLLAGEMDKMYVVASRSMGVPWRTIRRRHALRNIVAPVSIAFFSALRLMVGELILVEWIFAWPGLGRLLAFTLLGPRSMEPPRAIFLHPPTLALTLALLAALFLVTDLLTGLVARAADPRLRSTTAPDVEAARP
jgi:peptide/nickel transport system permease protein